MRLFGSKRAVVGGVAGLVVGGGGVALATILFATTVSGKASITTVDAKTQLQVSASATNASRFLDCKDLKLSPDFKTLTFNPTLAKLPTASTGTGRFRGAECTITLTVKNLGNTPVRVDPTSKLTVPNGWTASDFDGPGLRAIPPYRTGTVSAKVTATQAAVPGDVGGQVAYSTAESATQQ